MEVVRAAFDASENWHLRFKVIFYIHVHVFYELIAFFSFQL